MRKLRYGALAVIAAAAMVALLLATGWPQRVGLEWAAERALGARIEVRGLGLLRTLRAASIRVYDDAGERPVLEARDVVVKYRLWPKDGRRLDSVVAGFVGVDLEAQDATHSNFDFLSRLIDKPKSRSQSNPLAYVPRIFRVDVLSGRAQFPGMAVALNGLRAEGRALSRNQIEASVTGDGLEGQWTVPSQGVSGTFSDGRVNLTAELRDGGLRLKPMTVSLPGLVDVDGGAAASIGLGPDGLLQRVAELDLPRCRVQGADFSRARWSFVPFPVEFRSADLSGTKLKLVWNARGFFIPEAEVKGSAEALGLGLEGQEWYRGGLRVTGQGQDRKYTLEAVLGKGQKVVAEANGTPLNATGTVKVEGWSREQLLDALPVSLRPVLEKWPELKGLSGAAEWRWAKPGYEVKGTLDPVMEHAGRVSVEGRGALTGGPLFAGKVTADFGEGTVDADATVDSADRLKVEAKLDKVGLAALVGLVSDTTVFAKTGSTVSGTLRFGNEAKVGAVDLVFSPSPLPQVVAGDAVSVKGAFGVAGGAVSGKRLDLASGEDVRVAFRDWSLETQGAVLKGKFEGEAPAARLVPLAKIGLVGQVKASGPVTYAKGVVRVPFEATGEEFGQGKYSAPPGVPVTAKGTVRYDVKGAKGTVEGLNFLWTEGTRLAVETVGFTSSFKVGDTPYALETDLSPLVYLGMLPDVEGKATAKGLFRFADAFSAEADVSLEAPQMTLPNKLAVAGGAALRGAFRYAGGLSGEGQFGAAKVTAAGATVEDLRGPFTLKEGRVVSQGFEGRLWDGKATGDADAGLFVEGMPVTASATVAELNLETFTREYKPPKSKFTGLGGGTVSLEWSKEGFKDLKVDLASEEAFSVNRDLVYQLLMSGQIKDVKGGKRVDKIVERVLGEEEMRAFKRGEIVLEMESTDIKGVAQLDSESLNLTVDINMEAEALASLLKLRQEQNLEKIDTIKAEPVQLGK